MIAVDLADLEKPSPVLDDEASEREANEALIGIAHTLARGNPATAFSLLVGAVEAFALDSNSPVECLDVALLRLSALQADLDQVGEDVIERAIDGVVPHDPTGSPIDAATYEAERAADPDPRDEDA